MKLKITVEIDDNEVRDLIRRFISELEFDLLRTSKK